MALQVLQARIFSVTTWYHLSFLVISVAMFGLTLGALHAHRQDEAMQRRDYGALMSRATSRFGYFILLGLVAQLLLPLAFYNPMMTVVFLPLVAGCTVPAYFQAGYALSLAITRAPFHPTRTYGFDLIGAAAGCLLSLWGMNTLDAPSCEMLVAAAAIFAAGCFAPTGRRAALYALVIAVIAAANVAVEKPFIYPLFVKNNMLPEETLAYDKWNSISRVTLSKENVDAKPFLWGGSPKLPNIFKVSNYMLTIDGDAGTPLNKFDGNCASSLDFLDYDVTTIAYSLPNLQKAGIIGLGGGRDVLSACHAGIHDIKAMDVNATQVALLSRIEPYRSYTKVAQLPGVELIHSEARSWFTAHPDTFDIIQMSLIDTWAATGAGAFALSENGIYTVEAWRTFLSRLRLGGAMTVSRWYLSDAHSEVERLMSLAVAAEFKLGVAEPRKHIFVATSGYIATLVLSRDPFTDAQLDAMEKRAKKMDFRILISPRLDVPEKDVELRDILTAPTPDALRQVTDRSIFDLRPPTDERPFFFNQVRITNPAHVLSLIIKNEATAMLGHARAIFNLYVIIILAVAVTLATIVWPLKREIRDTSARFIAGSTAWFALIGLGFMFIEISLLQRLSVYLGHPAYGLSIVLFSLVLSTGIGSMLCARFPLKTKAMRMTWAVVTAATAAGAAFNIGYVTVNFAESDMLTRVSLSIGLIAPLGCFLGFGFPTGMEMASAVNSRATAWLWGVNGAAGVMGSTLAIAFNIALGIDWTLCLGGLCYLALVIPAAMAGHGAKAGTGQSPQAAA